MLKNDEKKFSAIDFPLENLNFILYTALGVWINKNAIYLHALSV